MGILADEKELQTIMEIFGCHYKNGCYSEKYADRVYFFGKRRIALTIRNSNTGLLDVRLPNSQKDNIEAGKVWNGKKYYLKTRSKKTDFWNGYEPSFITTVGSIIDLYR